MQYSLEHLKTMVYAEFGEQTECIMGNWKIENVRLMLLTVYKKSYHSFIHSFIPSFVHSFMPTRQIKCLKKRIANKVTKIVCVQCVKALLHPKKDKVLPIKGSMLRYLLFTSFYSGAPRAREAP